MEYLKLIGIVIIVVGFACKLDSILVIMVAAIATALEAVVEHPEGDIAGVGGGSEHWARLLCAVECGLGAAASRGRAGAEGVRRACAYGRAGAAGAHRVFGPRALIARCEMGAVRVYRAF